MADRDELMRRLLIPIPHRVIDEDCWYSCPKSGECCDESRKDDPCDCGADAENALRQEAAQALSAQQPVVRTWHDDPSQPGGGFWINAVADYSPPPAQQGPTDEGEK